MSPLSRVKSCKHRKSRDQRALFLLILILANLFSKTFAEVSNETMTVKKLGSLLENLGQQLLELKNEMDIANQETKEEMKNLKNTPLILTSNIEIFEVRGKMWSGNGRPKNTNFE